jgi:hypothetical protein
MARCSSPRHLRAMVGDDDGDRRKSRFSRRAATRVGRTIRICQLLIAGAAALLLTYPFIAALIKWAGIAYLLFIAWQLARPQSNATRKELNPTGLKPLSFWQSAALQYANPKAWMLAAATAGSFMASNATVASIAIIVIVFSVAASAVLSHGPGWAPRCETGLAPAREYEPSTPRWARSSPLPHCGWRCCKDRAITSPGSRRGRPLYCLLLFLGALSSSCWGS